MEVLLELLKNSPQSIAVVVVVLILIKYFERRDKSSREYDQEREQRAIAVQDRINEEHMHARAQAQEAINRNTAIMERNVSATDRNTYMIDTLSKTLQDYVSRQQNRKQ